MLEVDVRDTLISVNHYKGLNGGRTYIPKKTLNYINNIKFNASLKYPLVNNKPFYPNQRLRVNLSLFMGTKRRKDIDNYSKCILDALSGLFWFDDEQIDVLHITKQYRKKKEGFKLSVEVI